MLIVTLNLQTTTPNFLVVRVRLTCFRTSPGVLLPQFLHVAFVPGRCTVTPRAAVLWASGLIWLWCKIIPDTVCTFSWEIVYL